MSSWFKKGNGKGKAKKGESSTSHTYRTEGEDKSSLPNYPSVEFSSAVQKERFMKLTFSQMNPTRFPCTVIAGRLGFADDLIELLHGTGFTGLFGMSALTYRLLTLEFLSSFDFNREFGLVSFRINNVDWVLTLDDIGRFLSLVRNSTQTSPPRYFDAMTLARAISNQQLRVLTKIRVNGVEHPIIKLWFRYLIASYFGRPDASTTNSTELNILGAYLNVQGTPRFELDLPYLVANFWEGVALGRISTIEIGGLITVLVKRAGIYDPDEDPHVQPMEPLVRYFDMHTLSRMHHWLEIHEGGRYSFQVTKDPKRVITVPCELPPLVPMPLPGVQHHMPSYLIPENFGAPPFQTRYGGYVISSDEDDEDEA